MHGYLRRRFWVETATASVCAALCLLTILWNDWIEIVFQVDPDQHGGSLEWLIVAASSAGAVTLVALARNEWRRPAEMTV